MISTLFQLTNLRLAYHQVPLSAEKRHYTAFEAVTEFEMLGYLVAYEQTKPDHKPLQALLDLPEPTCAKELKRVSGLLAYYAKWIPNFSKAGSLLHCKALPLSNKAVIAFKTLKNDLCNASLGSIQDGVPFEVETDASDFALAAVLS